MDRKLIKFRNNVLGDVSSRQYLKTPYLVFAVAILLTVAVTYFFYGNVDGKDRARFSNDVTKINSTIQERLNSYITLLKSSRGFFKASRTAAGKDANKDSFAEFVASLEIEQKFQGAQGIGFIKPVKPSEQSALEEKMRAEGHQNFTFFPAEFRNSDAYAILHLEPLGKDANSSGIGYIISNEPRKRAAIEKAINTGEPAISEKVFLFRQPVTPATIKRPGFQLFVPIYKTENIPATESERKEQIEGLVYCPFRAVNFVDEVKGISAVTDISFAIYDREITPDTLLADSASPNKDPGAENKDSAAENKNAANSNGNTQSLSQLVYDNMRFEQTIESNIGNEKWLIKFRTMPAFHSNSSTGWTLIIFFFGLGISLLLFFITLSQSRAHTNLGLIAEELARSEKVKDEFISVVSHELRTPLNSIAGGVTILKNRGANDETRAKALDIIDKNLRSQANLVDDMIVFSDINAGKDYLQLVPLNFLAVLDRVIKEILPQAVRKNISVLSDIQLARPMVAGDEAKLEKVLHSILSNSLKFTQPNGQITISTTDDNDEIELKIKDNGFGIHPQVLPYVFDLFKQGDSSTVRRHGGLGLGLTLSHHIIKLHGGTLEAESEGVDKGATFIIKLPVLTTPK